MDFCNFCGKILNFAATYERDPSDYATSSHSNQPYFTDNQGKNLERFYHQLNYRSKRSVKDLSSSACYELGTFVNLFYVVFPEITARSSDHSEKQGRNAITEIKDGIW